jgi:hypothetical protein
VVFSTFSDSAYSSGFLRVVRGDTGVENLDFITKTQSFPVDAVASIAVANLGIDSYPDILAVHEDGVHIMCFDHTGTFQWISNFNNADPVGWGGPAVAYLHAGSYPDKPNIIVGRTVYDYLGHIVWFGSDPYGTGGPDGAHNGKGPLSTVANLVGNGPDVVTGNTAYVGSTGAVLWYNPNVPDGFPGVADINKDGHPEVVVVVPGTDAKTDPCKVYLLNGQTKDVIWTTTINDSGGGAPTIAHFSGASSEVGYPQIGVATSHNYTVISHTGAILWKDTINDSSSGEACGSAFDFDGDGKAEIVYADQTTLYIFDGTTGDVLWSTQRPSGTTYDMPAIADINDGNHAEIVVNVNSYYNNINGYTGLAAYANAQYWQDCPPIWNQHTYHITNIHKDGTVPTVEPNNWDSPELNNFRTQNGTGFLTAPLPSVGGVAVPSEEVGVLVPYIGLASAIAVAAVATAICFKRVKHRKEKP